MAGHPSPPKPVFRCPSGQRSRKTIPFKLSQLPREPTLLMLKQLCTIPSRDSPYRTVTCGKALPRQTSLCVLLDSQRRYSPSFRPTRWLEEKCFSLVPQVLVL